MRLPWIFLLAICSTVAVPAQSLARDYLGAGVFLTNDVFATIQDDRWRTGAGALSFGWGTAEDLLELRLRAEVITPGNLVRPTATDRPYAATLSVGAHRHFRFNETELSYGADLVFAGEQTGLHELQAAIHDVIGVPPPSQATLATYIPNDIYLAGTIELAQRVPLNDRTLLRPFMEVQAGVETLLRVGGDLHFGVLARDEALIRDVSSGHRYRLGRQEGTGWAAVLGADVAYVADSVFLPAGGAAPLSDTRSRVRAGVHWQGSKAKVFYGLTWLSKEFDTQRESQIIGGVSVDFWF